MHLRTRLHVYAVIPCVALGLLAQPQAPSPVPDAAAAVKGAEPVKVPAHPSRWDYPKELTPPPGTQLHFVQKGDTLWDLGQKYLGNPFAWPQIWELNKWVKDPHWIYPGDPLLVDASRSSVPQAKDQDLTSPEVAELQPDLRRTPKPTLDEYAFSFQDFIQLPYLVNSTAEAHFKALGAVKITGRQDSTRQLLGDGDFVYVGGGSSQGFKAGDRLVVTKILKRKFYHPDDRHHHKAMGDILQQAGVLRLTKVYAGRSVAIVERSLDGLLVGEWAAPFTEPANIVANPRTDTGSPVAPQDPVGKVIFIRENRPVAAGGDMVIMDKGAKQGFKVGDVLLTYRTRPLDPSQAAKDAETTNYYLGQMIVVRTEENTATCRLLRAKEEVAVSDLITR